MATKDPTTNYSWNLPAVGGSAGAWGTALNAIIGDDSTGIDAVVKAISDVANAALARAGGTMTGEITGHTQTWDHNVGGSVSGATNVSLDTANSHSFTITAATTFSFTDVPSTGKAVFLTIELTNGGTSVTWPAEVQWAGGSAPSLTGSGTDILTFFTRDGGTTWYGALAISNAS